jgi:NarL family two-component system response regulator LiaR
MDLVMPEVDGIKAISTIHRQHPEIRIVALTSFKEDELVFGALEAGATSYVLKNASVDELIDVIRKAYDGHPTLAWEATQVLITGAVKPDAAPKMNLTPREQDVLSLMAKGLTNRQIAERLEISPFTVNAHVGNILSKLQAESRTEAVAIALQNNLITGD